MSVKAKVEEGRKMQQQNDFFHMQAGNLLCWRCCSPPFLLKLFREINACSNKCSERAKL